MTSFSKALFRRDPAAAEAFHEAQKFEHKIVYGRVPTLAAFSPEAHGLARKGFTPAWHEHRIPMFGRRAHSPIKDGASHACAANCGHPACKHGCTLIGQGG